MDAQTNQTINTGTGAAEGQPEIKGGNLERRERWMKRRRRHMRRMMRQQSQGQPVNLTININNGPQGHAGPEGSGMGRRAMNRPRQGWSVMPDEQGGGRHGRRHGHGPTFGRGPGGRRGRTMKITTPQGYVIEMSPEEAQAMFPDLFRGMRRQVAGMSGEGDGSPVSERRLIRRVLKRHRIPPAQRAVYKALYAAGDEGLDFTTLAATIGRSTEELSGVLGGLGRRINATGGIETLPEAPGVGLLFEHKEVAPPNGTWGWALKPEFRQVLTDLDLPWLTGEDDDSIESA